MASLRSWFPAPWVLIGWTVAFGVAQVLSMVQAPVGSGSWNGLLWLSPGVAASALLLHSRRQWPVLVIAYWVICAVVLLGFGKSPGQALVGPVNNIVEQLLIGSMLWSDRDWVEGRSDRLRSWMWFGLSTLVVAPALGAVIGVAIVVPLGLPVPVLAQTVVVWFVSDALSLAVIMPLILRLRPRGLRQLRGGGLLRQAVVLSGLVGLAVVIFSGDLFLPLFLVPLPLVLLLFRSGFAGLAVGMAVQVVIALALTAAGHGPLQTVTGGDPRAALLSCQIYLICVFVLMVVIAALLDERRRLTVMESASFEVYDWVGRLSGDLVMVGEPGGWLVYCTPSVGDLLGVSPADMLGHGWQKLVHPGDRDDVRRMIATVDRLGQVEETFRMRHTKRLVALVRRAAAPFGRRGGVESPGCRVDAGCHRPA